MKFKNYVLAGLLLAVCSLLGLANEPAPEINNQNVINMTASGLTPDAIKAKIRSSVWKFDISEKALALLKEKNVDNTIILMMVQAPTGPPKERYVAEFYQYLGSLQITGTNFIPSLFSPYSLGIVYILLLSIIWIGITRWRSTNDTMPLLISFAVVVIVLILAGVIVGRIGIASDSWKAVHINSVDFQFIKQRLPPGADPCVRPPLFPPSGKPETSTALPSSSAGPGTGGVTVDAQPCKQPDTSQTPDEGDVGMIASVDGGTGKLSLKRKQGSKLDYKLEIKGIERAGRYEGKVVHDSVGPNDVRTVVTVSDWWPYFFVTVLLGIAFSNNVLKLPEDVISKSFAEQLNGPAVNTVSGLAALLVTIYTQYVAGWGTTTDYVKAFLAGAAITLGTKVGTVAFLSLASYLHSKHRIYKMRLGRRRSP